MGRGTVLNTETQMHTGHEIKKTRYRGKKKKISNMREEEKEFPGLQ